MQVRGWFVDGFGGSGVVVPEVPAYRFCCGLLDGSGCNQMCLRACSGNFGLGVPWEFGCLN